MKSYSVTIQMKAIEQYFPVVLFIIMYEVVLTFEFVDEIPQCNHSNESLLAILLFGAVCFSLFCKMKFNTSFPVLIQAETRICNSN